MSKEIFVHEVIGELEWDRHGYGEDYFCDREFEFIGIKCKFQIAFISYGDKVIDEQQVYDYNYFIKNNDSILSEIAEKIFVYYNELYDENECEFDELGLKKITQTSEIIPLIGDADAQDNYIISPTIYIKQDRDYIGFSVGCEWDIDNGLGVKIVDGKVEEIGFQDIVL